VFIKYKTLINKTKQEKIMIITISGSAGSGKDTVGKIIAKKLNYKFYSMGDLKREKAERKGMTIEEYNKLGETDKSTDTEVDEYQAEIGKKNDNFVIVGRTSFHFIPKSLKIFLDVDVKEAAKRIMSDKTRVGEKYKNIKDAVEKLKKRKVSDDKRYKKYYKLDIFDKKHYDLLMDTTEITPDEVADKIINFIKNYNKT
jgi:predicted cytidylate kinase